MSKFTSSDSAPIAVVTGGGSGIGYATAHLLAEDGMIVAIVGRNEMRLDRAASELRDKGHSVRSYVCDVRVSAAVCDLGARIVDELGHPTVLVNNAGRSGGGVTTEIADDAWLDMIDSNLNSVFWMTREIVRRNPMIRRAQGRVINIASTGGKQGVPFGASYSAAKAGVIGFTKALAKEYALSGPTVNAICPGYVETPMADEIREKYAELDGVTESEVLASFNAKIPIGRYSTPEEVAGMIRYLVSPAAASVTAQAMNVCGGLGIF